MSGGLWRRRGGILAVLVLGVLARISIVQPAAHADAVVTAHPVTVTATALAASGWQASAGAFTRADGSTVPVLHITMACGTFTGWRAALAGSPALSWGSVPDVVGTAVVIDADSVTIAGTTYDAAHPPSATMFPDGSGTATDLTIRAELVSAATLAAPRFHLTVTP